ncbi:MAG: helix-turn-helix transcriptional regulator [Corynebacterium sp.]|nr:helix-turn-helix transcriptional regulator [Corynebacterium sp.]
MSTRDDVRAFLMSRRARVTPERAGRQQLRGHRCVTGMRRSEVAMLENVSVEYYAKIERGNIAGVSDSVLESIVRALRLDDAEHEQLFDLARTANGVVEPVRRRPTSSWHTRKTLIHALNSFTGGPAVIRNGCMDILATNPMGRQFYDWVFDGPGRGNLARFTFLDDRARDFHPDWNDVADICVAILRLEAGRSPHDKHLHDLIGELSTCSADFRTRWSAHNVRRHGTGTKSFHHHLVGDLTLTYEEMALVSEPGLSFMIYTAEPGSESVTRVAHLSVTTQEEQQ